MLAPDFPYEIWASILDRSRGLTSATAHELAEHDMDLRIVHRGRRGAMRAVSNPGIENLCGLGIELRSRNFPRDPASIIDLFWFDEATWINSDFIRADGGEHVSGVTR